jgi:hypothetical protein
MYKLFYTSIVIFYKRDFNKKVKHLSYKKMI